MARHNILKEEAKRIAEQIAFRSKPKQVILFGSLLNGSEDPGDIDLLVIKETKEKKVKRAQNLYKILDWSFPLDIVVRTPEEVKEGLSQKNPFYINALRGEVLYESR